MIQEVLMENLRLMEAEDWALSPSFLRLMGKHNRAAEVEQAMEQHLQLRSSRKARKMQQAKAPAADQGAHSSSAATDE